MSANSESVNPEPVNPEPVNTEPVNTEHVETENTILTREDLKKLIKHRYNEAIRSNNKYILKIKAYLSARIREGLQCTHPTDLKLKFKIKDIQHELLNDKNGPSYFLGFENESYEELEDAYDDIITGFSKELNLSCTKYGGEYTIKVDEDDSALSTSYSSSEEIVILSKAESAPSAVLAVSKSSSSSSSEDDEDSD